MSNQADQKDQTTGKVPADESPSPRRGAWRRPVLLVVVLVAVAVLARVFGVGEKLGELRQWLVSLGPWGPLVFVLIYIVGVVAAVPGTAITIAAAASSARCWGSSW